MMNKFKPHTIQERAQLLGELVQTWLSTERPSLKNAITKTVEQGLFTAHDIQFALDHIKASVGPESLQKWALDKKQLKGFNPKSVLCLHAGNLPLVGFQDIIATLLSGHRYFGKLSRKDPFILKDFLDFIQEDNRFLVGKYSTDLTDFSGLKTDVLLFSGSESGSIEVENRLNEMEVINPKTKQLIRTAHASVVWFEDALGGWESLAESIFRYEGRGCRSVAVIFTPNEPEDILERLRIEGEKFIQINPPLTPVSEEIRFRFAYNQAIERASFNLGNMLIEVGNPSLKKDHVVTISRGSMEDAREFIKQSGNAVQAFYSNIEGLIQTEPLSEAQTPPIYWKPDGVDPLEFLLNVD